ncbi:hypothetical protein niasHT_008533 [Heterodera trifolii]|uniref:DNA-directed DNA polymerase n=1 Tax=Heterodera trifolii TaxID=157864 RepID=A0ABD2LXZ4_9BILA
MRRVDFCSDHKALNRLMSNRERMKTAVKELMRAVDIAPDQEAYGMEHLVKIQQHWDRLYTGMYRIVLFTDQPEELPRPIWKGPMGRRFCVTLFLSEGHYHGIKKIHCFFKLRKKYCVDCECFYDRDVKHTMSCKSRCYQCGKVGPQYPCVREQGVCLNCQQCNRVFFSQRCFDGHRPQMCNLVKRCDDCDRTYQIDRKNPHKCYTNYCTRCKVYHEKEGACFIKPTIVPDEKPKYRMVCWDTETRLERLQQVGQQRHKVNYLSARVTCTECCDSENGVGLNCKICLTTYGAMERMKDWSEAEGHEPISAFVEWILKAWDNKYQTFIWFRLQHSRRHSKLTWRDSCLLMPIRLEEMPKTFSHSCADKPFFPYAFNRKYDENKCTPFYLPDELKTYCRNNTEILLAAVVQFRQILMREITEGFDVLPLSATIASICMTIFKGKFLNEKELAIVPEGGYERNDRASVFAIKYLDWRSKRDGVRIQHAGNGLEKRWRQFKLDGWIAEQNKCIEVLGCYWHGCESCFKPDDELVDGKTCRELNDATKLRLLKLQEPVPTEDAYGGEDEQGLDVEEIWKCQIREQLKRDDEMRDFFDDLGTDRGPIDPRQTFYGGRTGPLQLIAEPKEDEKISVFDIVSLYPWVNYATDYPTGIRAVIHPTVEEMIVDWTRTEHLQYQGIYRVRVSPPKGLRIPVLPLKIDERLLFCCCHRCAAKFRKLNTRRVHKCPHTDEQRAFTGNFTHIELARALETGYRVDRFWRAWHYDEWSDGIFKDYVRLLIKLKVEASGFPDGANTVEQQQQFADEYRRIYNVNLDLENVRRNPGLRFISKLMLNSLWGKFGMRNELGANKVLTRPQEFFSLIMDHKIEVSAVIPLSDTAVRVMYKSKKNFVSEHTSSNIVISLWTTSRARLKLLDFMTQIDRTEGANCYIRVAVLHKRDIVPIQTGEYLGQMSEEYLNYEIKTFVCGGAKQYGFRMLNKRTGEVEYVQKIRGITFDVNNRIEPVLVHPNSEMNSLPANRPTAPLPLFQSIPPRIALPIPPPNFPINSAHQPIPLFCHPPSFPNCLPNHQPIPIGEPPNFPINSAHQPIPLVCPPPSIFPNFSPHHQPIPIGGPPIPINSAHQPIPLFCPPPSFPNYLPHYQPFPIVCPPRPSFPNHSPHHQPIPIGCSPSLLPFNSPRPFFPMPLHAPASFPRPPLQTFFPRPPPPLPCPQPFSTSNQQFSNVCPTPLISRPLAPINSPPSKKRQIIEDRAERERCGTYRSRHHDERRPDKRHYGVFADRNGRRAEYRGSSRCRTEGKNKSDRDRCSRKGSVGNSEDKNKSDQNKDERSQKVGPIGNSEGKNKSDHTRDGSQKVGPIGNSEGKNKSDHTRDGSQKVGSVGNSEGKNKSDHTRDGSQKVGSVGKSEGKNKSDHTRDGSQKVGPIGNSEGKNKSDHNRDGSQNVLRSIKNRTPTPYPNMFNGQFETISEEYDESPSSPTGPISPYKTPKKIPLRFEDYVRSQKDLMKMCIEKYTAPGTEDKEN